MNLSGETPTCIFQRNISKKYKSNKLLNIQFFKHTLDDQEISKLEKRLMPKF